MSLLGFTTHIDEVGNAVGKLGEGEPQIILLGHMDTVKGFLPVVEKDGKIYGRGSVDAKGPLAAFITAAAEVKDKLQLSLLIIGAVEEEVTSSAGAHYAAGKYNPKYCIVGEPSGWEGITLGYKGSLHLDYIIREEKLHYSGRRVTAAEKGVNFWNDLKAYCNNYNTGKKIFDSLLPTLITLTSSDDDFHLELVQKINLRLPPEFQIDPLKQWMTGRKNGAVVNFAGHEKAIKMNKSNALVRNFLKVIRKFNGKSTFKYKTGTSDMNVVGHRWNCPMVAYGPGDSTLDHSPNEHIHIEEYLKGIEVLKQVLVALK